MSMLYDVTISMLLAMLFPIFVYYLWEALIMFLGAKSKAFRQFADNHVGIAAPLTFIPCIVLFALLCIAFYDEKCVWLRYFYNNQWCANEVVSNIIKIVVCAAVMIASFIGSVYIFFENKKIDEKIEEKIGRINKPKGGNGQ